MLCGLYEVLGDPDYNGIVHSKPAEDDHKAYYPWHLQLLPRFTTMMPEEAAAFMRESLERDRSVE